MINFKKYLAMNEVNNININDLVDSIIRCTHNRIDEKRFRDDKSA